MGYPGSEPEKRAKQGIPDGGTEEKEPSGRGNLQADFEIRRRERNERVCSGGG